MGNPAETPSFLFDGPTARGPPQPPQYTNPTNQNNNPHQPGPAPPQQHQPGPNPNPGAQQQGGGLASNLQGNPGLALGGPAGVLSAIGGHAGGLAGLPQLSQQQPSRGPDLSTLVAGLSQTQQPNELLQHISMILEQKFTEFRRDNEEKEVKRQRIRALEVTPPSKMSPEQREEYHIRRKIVYSSVISSEIFQPLWKDPQCDDPPFQEAIRAAKDFIPKFALQMSHREDLGWSAKFIEQIINSIVSEKRRYVRLGGAKGKRNRKEQRKRDMEEAELNATKAQKCLEVYFKMPYNRIHVAGLREVMARKFNMPAHLLEGKTKVELAVQFATELIQQGAVEVKPETPYQLVGERGTLPPAPLKRKRGIDDEDDIEDPEGRGLRAATANLGFDTLALRNPEQLGSVGGPPGAGPPFGNGLPFPPPFGLAPAAGYAPGAPLGQWPFGVMGLEAGGRGQTGKEGEDGLVDKQGDAAAAMAGSLPIPPPQPTSDLSQSGLPQPAAGTPPGQMGVGQEGAGFAATATFPPHMLQTMLPQGIAHPHAHHQANPFSLPDPANPQNPGAAGHGQGPPGAEHQQAHQEQQHAADATTAPAPTTTTTTTHQQHHQDPHLAHQQPPPEPDNQPQGGQGQQETAMVEDQSVVQQQQQQAQQQQAQEAEQVQQVVQQQQQVVVGGVPGAPDGTQENPQHQQHNAVDQVQQQNLAAAEAEQQQQVQQQQAQELAEAQQLQQQQAAAVAAAQLQQLQQQHTEVQQQQANAAEEAAAVMQQQVQQQQAHHQQEQHQQQVQQMEQANAVAAAQQQMQQLPQSATEVQHHHEQQQHQPQEPEATQLATQPTQPVMMEGADMPDAEALQRQPTQPA